MAIKHKVIINVTDEQGNKKEVLRGGELTLHQKIIKFLFGDYRQVFLLDPGKSVKSVDIKEIKEGGSTNGQDENLSLDLEELRKCANTINEIADSLESTFSSSNEKTKEEKKPITLEEVRAVLAEKSRNGKTAEVESISISNNVKWGTRKRFQKGIPNGKFIIYGYRWEGDHLVIEPKEAEIVKLIYKNYMNGISAESTENQLEQMGVKSYKGGHFGASSIRHILYNIIYTGNLLFQKEYVVDPISKKTRINKGELPQYFVENTHEPIIPMEEYMAVQEERKRRREMGARANRGINVTCFTSKVKCPLCGKSYRRSGKRQSKKNNDVYYIWICQTKSFKEASVCSAKIVPELELKLASSKVLGLEEFDTEIFDKQIEKVVPIGEDILEFHFYDGKVIKQEWHSHARIRCWSEERKKAWGKEIRKRWKDGVYVKER